MLTFLAVGILLLGKPILSRTQNPETVWSSVVVTLHGDRVPLISPDLSILTAVGAQQLHSAGGVFRDRYIAPSTPAVADNRIIRGISTDEIDNTQTFVESTLDPFNGGSAQAFMQGLYPPTNGTFRLSNGTEVQYPSDGYQYPQLYTASPWDPNSIWLAGGVNCNAYKDATEQYFRSTDFQEKVSETEAFYAGLEPDIFAGVLNNSLVNYRNAYYIFDYINYVYQWNSTIPPQLSVKTFFTIQTLADEWEHAVNGNVSAGNGISTIAGQTLSAHVLDLLVSNIQTNGANNKLNLLFTSFEPMVSFAALAGLTDFHNDFYGLPQPGSSMIFEMFSSGANFSNTYPDPSDLMVRFLFRNGTDSPDNITPYPIFDNDRNSLEMSFNDFVSGMENVMVTSVGEWCAICRSRSIFCAAFANDLSSNSTGSPSSSSAKVNAATRPAVAGIIGALIGLIMAGTVLAIAMLVFGVRFFRTKTKRRSELAGFKGAEKLASDRDLTIVKSSGVGATVVGKGHERVGSWELGESNRAKGAGSREVGGGPRASFDDDGISIVDHHSEPVKVVERV
ncbi:MAG: hypothetical protein Q9187_007259 [Circinaria calcarea]